MTFDEAIMILNYLIFSSDGAVEARRMAVEARRMAVAALSNGDDLKPCPFCGDDVDIDGKEINCTNCGLVMCGMDSAKLKKTWNERVDE